MSDLFIVLIVGIGIPVLLIMAVTLYDMFRDEHPYRRASDH